MNDHLLPIFDIIFPELRKGGILFWVFGGIAIAGMKGEFLRKNNDIDTFVLENDYGKTKLILEELCSRYSNWKICHSILRNIRPKIEICVDEKEVFSLIPVYCKKGGIQFLFPNGGDIFLPSDILNSVNRKVGELNFSTPPNEFIRKLFENHYKLLLKRGHKGRHMDNYKIDKHFIDSLTVC